MQVVCEATQSSSVQVQAMAFECLVRIMTLYYSKMAYYMERALFGVDHILHHLPVLFSDQRHVIAHRDGHEIRGRVCRVAGDRILDVRCRGGD